MNTLLLIVQLLPAILKTVLDFETLIPQSGMGATKLDLLLKGIGMAYTELGSAMKGVPTFDRVQNFVTRYVGVVVDVLNKTGVFQKSAPVPQT
jgi:hypothetical protein